MRVQRQGADPRPLVLGLTGGIASGKSTVARMLAECGAEVVSADALAREAVAPGTPALAALVERFGPAILGPDGSLERKELARIVFADAAARRKLEAITHPAIRALAEARIAALRRRGSLALVVYEAPLLFEAGAEGRVDRVLVVAVDEDVQLRRVMARDGLTRAEAQARIAAQMPQAEKLRRADFVLENSGSEAELRGAVEALFRRLTAAERES